MVRTTINLPFLPLQEQRFPQRHHRRDAGSAATTAGGTGTGGSTAKTKGGSNTGAGGEFTWTCIPPTISWLVVWNFFSTLGINGL